MGAATAHPDFPDRASVLECASPLALFDGSSTSAHARELAHGEMSKPEAERILATAFP